MSDRKSLRSFKGLRCDLNLTQKEMADELGIPLTNYQRYESYKVQMPAFLLIQIANMCNIVDVREIKIK